MSESGACAIGYARVSSRGQEAGGSLAHQRRVIADWAQRHNIPLVSIVDNAGRAESGADDTRAGLREVQALIAAHPVRWVVVSRIDRWARDLRLYVESMRDWEARGLRLVAVEDGQDDPHAPASRLLMQVLALVAEDERRRIVGRIGPGLRARVGKGLPLGRPPYGYRVCAGAPGLEPDPAQATVLRGLFHHALHDGWGPARLAAWARTQDPGRRWSSQAVKRLLVNRSYIGELQVRVGEQVSTRPEHHAALVDAADFARVAERMATRRTQAEQRANDAAARSLLGGIARCSACGAVLTIRTLADGPHYVCHGRSSDGSACRAASTPCAVDGHLMSLLYRHLETALRSQLQVLLRQGIQDLPQHMDALSARAEATLAGAAQREERLMDQLAEGALDQAAYCAAMQRLEQDRVEATRLTRTRDGCEVLRGLCRMDDPTASSTLLYLPLPEVIAQLDLAQQRRLLRRCLRHCRLPAAEWPFMELAFSSDLADYSELRSAFGRRLARSSGPGIDVRAGLLGSGYIQDTNLDPVAGEVWRHPCGSIITLRPDGRMDLFAAVDDEAPPGTAVDEMEQWRRSQGAGHSGPAGS